MARASVDLPAPLAPAKATQPPRQRTAEACRQNTPRAASAATSPMPSAAFRAAAPADSVGHQMRRPSADQATSTGAAASRWWPACDDRTKSRSASSIQPRPHRLAPVAATGGGDGSTAAAAANPGKARSASSAKGPAAACQRQAAPSNCTRIGSDPCTGPGARRLRDSPGT
jgi:hypothetical protein